MRAVFHSFDSAPLDSIMQVTGDIAHHLNVVRVRTNEVVLLLNGKGLKASGTIVSVQKNLVEIKITNVEQLNPSHELSLAIACPKKDAFEDIIKAAVELGIRDIYPLTSEFSQYRYESSERMERIVESALVQSNNSFWPRIHSQVTLANFLSKQEDMIVFFNSILTSKVQKDTMTSVKKTILIGPEGGFSPAEVAQITQYSKIQEIHLPTPILRAPTAVCASVGYLLSSLK